MTEEQNRQGQQPQNNSSGTPNASNQSSITGKTQGSPSGNMPMGQSGLGASQTTQSSSLQSGPVARHTTPTGVPSGGIAGPGNAARTGAPPPGASTASGSTRLSQPQYSQADLNKIVLDYLNKKGYHRTESMLRLESSNTPTSAVPAVTPGNTPMAGPGEISRRERELREKVSRNEREFRELREKQLRVERELRESRDREFRMIKENELKELKELEEKKKRESNPETYLRGYSMLRSWVSSSLDLYRTELTRILYPLFIHCFLELIAKGFTKEAKEFMDKFKDEHILLHGDEISQLAGISLPEHLKENTTAQAYRQNRYKIIVSKTTINLLLFFLHENEQVGGAVLIRIINQYIQPEIETTKPDRKDLEGDSNPEEGIPGLHLQGGSTTAIDKFNEQPVKLGKLPMDSEVQKEVEAELKVKDEKIEPVNGKSLVEEFKKINEEDENSPSRDSLPLPPADSSDIKRLIMSVEDSRQKIRLGGANGTVQASCPSVCMYTFHNASSELTCLDFNEDSNLVAGGFQDSSIKLWSLDGKPLKSVFKRDPENNSSYRKLIGHSGPVYGVSFSPDNKFLISGSEDKTVRLWSLDSYSALVSYKGHNQPVWDVKFSPMGHYFATASHDQTARLWATDHIYPLRIFAGHINDVDCVEFHPNSNYVFTGSSDKTCRMWDVTSGSSVRIFLGHTSPINCMAVSPDGRWLASAGEDSVVNVWDIGSGRKLKSMRGHGRSSIYSLAFSKDGGVLVSGGADNTVRVWDVKKSTNDSGFEPEAFSWKDNGANSTGSKDSTNGNDESTGAATNNNNGSNITNGKGNGNSNNNNEKSDNTKSRKEILATTDHMTAYFTKKTPVFKLHFTRRNLCLAGGAFLG